MKYKGIMFDFNGVILWDAVWQDQAWQEAAKELRGRELAPQEIQDFIRGTTNKEGFLFLLGEKRVNDEELNQLIFKKEENYRNIAIKQPGFHLSPGAVELFDFLKQSNIPFTIATSSEENNVQFFFKNLALDKWFSIDGIVYDNGRMPSKPAPDIYLKAAAKINVPPAECLVVEDAKSGIMSAHSAGIGKIIALGPVLKHEMFKALPGVSKIVTSLAEIGKEDFES